MCLSPVLRSPRACDVSYILGIPRTACTIHNTAVACTGRACGRVPSVSQYSCTPTDAVTCKLYKYMAKNNMFDKLLKQAEEADKKPKK